MSALFADKVAIVTGAARGIGAAAARMFADEGASVVLGDVLPEVNEFAGQLGVAVALQGDVSDPDYAKALVDLAVETYGGLDFAFNNAGIGGKECDISDLEAGDWNKVIGVNDEYAGVQRKVRVPLLIKAKGARVGFKGLTAHGEDPEPSEYRVYGFGKARR